MEEESNELDSADDTLLPHKATQDGAVIAGRLYSIHCSPQGGVPLPELTLYKNNVQVGETRKGESRFRFRPQEGDHGEFVTCTAYNGVGGIVRADLMVDVQCEWAWHEHEARV